MTIIYQPDSSNSIPAQIAHQIASIIQTQIAGVVAVYEEPIDAAPEDMSVVIPPCQFNVQDDTNAKLYTKLLYPVRMIFRRTTFSENVTAAYSYMMPFLYAFSQWSNQSLGGLAISVCPKAGGVTQIIMSGQTVVSLLINIEVITEFQISTQ